MRTRAGPRRATPRRAAGLVLALAFTAVIAASIGCALRPEQEPGCHTDADCDPGATCKAGACFSVSTPAADAGDAAAE